MSHTPPVDSNGAENIFWRRSRLAGRSFEQFQEFVKACKNGEKIQLHGLDYVAVDRKSWDEMQSKLSTSKIYFGEAKTAPRKANK